MIKLQVVQKMSYPWDENRYFQKSTIDQWLELEKLGKTKDFKKINAWMGIFFFYISHLRLFD